MRKIYLASRSRARQEILKKLGFKFKILPSRAKESMKSNGSYAKLAMSNALIKAKDASRKVKSGVVIAADTFMVQDGLIFGKPRSLADAKRMLKIVSGKMQLVYTGIAVIDKDKMKTIVDYEKTRVYMKKLTDRDVEQYFSKVSPLDKAGSFDIQGEGAVFVKRIKGCFHNVVGLPVKKLNRILKKLEIHGACLLIIMMPVFICGCTTEYNTVTGEQEVYYYSTDREVELGRSVSKSAEIDNLLLDDPLVVKRIKDIGDKIVAVSDRKELAYVFKVLDDDEINAVSLPGGYVYINKGLIDRAVNDDELACVIAHEVGHIVARHAIKKLQATHGYEALRLLMASASAPVETGIAADMIFLQLLLGYAREDELAADQLGVRYAKLAGYDPHAMIKFLQKLQEAGRRKPLRPKTYFKTHPYPPDRIRVIKQELGEKIDFVDYVNIEQKPHR